MYYAKTRVDDPGLYFCYIGYLVRMVHDPSDKFEKG